MTRRSRSSTREPSRSSALSSHARCCGRGAEPTIDTSPTRRPDADRRPDEARARSRPRRSGSAPTAASIGQRQQRHQRQRRVRARGRAQADRGARRRGDRRRDVARNGPRRPAQGTRDGRDERRPRHRSRTRRVGLAVDHPRPRRRPRPSWSSTCCWRASTHPTAAPASVPPAWRRSCGLPYLSNAASIEPTDGGVRVRRITATGFETLEAPIPALIGCTQALGAPRYPTLKGIMGARSKEVAVLTLADLGLDAARGRRRGRDACRGPAEPPAAGRDPRRARRTGRHSTRGRRLPRHARARLMAGTIWVVGQAAPSGGLTRLSAEIATLARTLAEAGGWKATGSSSRRIRGRGDRDWPATCRGSSPLPSPPAERRRVGHDRRPARGVAHD